MADISQVRVNNTDYNFADDTKVPYDLLQDTVGFTSKNLIPINNLPQTTAGVTFTLKADGSVSAIGTLTANAWPQLNTDIRPYVEVGKTYIISGWNTGSPVITDDFIIQCGSDITGHWSDNHGNFTVTQADMNQPLLYRLGLRYSNIPDKNINHIFYPMFRKADIMDDTYEQYNPSVKQILRNNKIIEGKNLLNVSSCSWNSSNDAGVTLNNNHDGTFNVSGTATANPINVWILGGWNRADDTAFMILPAGKYIVSDCNLYRGSNEVAITNFGTGLSKEITLNADTPITGLRCPTAVNGSTYNTVIKPMIRKATETDSTYEPYYIPGVVSQEAQNILGAKNLLCYPFSNTTKTENGITFTDNGDGTITATGTNSSTSANANFECSVLESTFKLSKGYYKLTGCPKGGSGSTYLIQLYSTTTYFSSVRDDVGNGVNFYLPSDEAIRVVIRIRPEYAISGSLIFKPMIRLASVLDDTYTPYAMTNRELTELLNPVRSNLPHHSDFNDYFNWGNGVQKIVKMGHICEILVNDLECVQAFTMSSWKQIFYNLPRPITGNGIQGINVVINRTNRIDAQYDKRNSNPTGSDTWGLSITSEHEFSVGDRIRFHLMFICD